MNNYFLNSSKVIKSLKKGGKFKKIVKKIIDTYKLKGKVLVAGHGGSCSDAEHLLGELICTTKSKKRTNISHILASLPAAVTAWSNDFGFETFLKEWQKHI